jgi:hypothetical protein
LDAKHQNYPEWTWSQTLIFHLFLSTNNREVCLIQIGMFYTT